MATGIEPFVPKLTAFFWGVAQRCVVAGIKKWKETSDKTKEEAAAKLLQEHEAAKRIQVKIEQRISTSIRQLRFSPDQIRQILALDSDPHLKEALIEQFLAAELSADSIVALFIRQDPGLESVHSELHAISAHWLDAMDKAIAEDDQLSQVVDLRTNRLLRAGISSLGDRLARTEVKDAERDQIQAKRHEELMTTLAALNANVGLRSSSDGGSRIPEHLKNQNQRRFDRARKQLLEGSMANAEGEFRGLLEDLTALGNDVDKELLLRCYINLGSSLWEQNKQAEAVVFFDQAYALDPSDWRAKRSRAIALMDTDPNAALELFRAVRKERPNEVEHFCNEATQLKNSGRVAEAIELLESQGFDDADYYSILSFAYLNARRYEDAELAARKALQSDSESENAQTALAYAIGFPLIRLRMERKILQFAPSDKDHERLLEATSVAEKAVDKLRQHGRLRPLGELLTHISAFYVSAGDCGKAIDTAREALKINPDDPIILTNLWCAQMRQSKYNDAAETASKIAEIADPVPGWEKWAGALLLANRGDEVLDSWIDKKRDSRFSDNVDVLSLVARAFSGRHKTDEGLQLLNGALARHPSDARLLSERGHLLEGIGRNSEAAADLAAAESSSTFEQRVQVLVDHGMFLYRRGNWKAAADRFRELGAEGIHNPLFGPYINCLFNQGAYRQSVDLAEKAIAAGETFVEDYYAIAARCHHIGDNLPRAKELLNALVARGTARHLEHRKLLAWIYWRLDELPEAYDVLLKGLKISKDDLEALVLLSAVCSAQSKHAEALQFACRATEIAPGDVRSHTAMVSAVFSCPVDSKPEQKLLDAHFRSLAFLQNHESGIIRAVPVEPDLHSILEMVKARSSAAQKLEDYYQSHKLPMGFFAHQADSSIFKMWASLLGHRRLQVRMAFGNDEEQRTEIQAAVSNDTISVDLFALLTLQHLKLLHLPANLFRKIYAHSSVLDAVVEDIREIQKNPRGGSIGYVNGKFITAERTIEQSHQVTAFLAEIRDFLKSPKVILTGLLPDALNSESWLVLTDKCGAVHSSNSSCKGEGSSMLFG